MKTVCLLFPLFLYSIFSFGQTPTPHVPDHVIIEFSDNSSQAERQGIVDDLGSLLSGVSYNMPGSYTILQEVLILVSGYPVTVGSHTYYNEVDLISNIQNQQAKVDNADFNYAMTTEQYSFSSFLGANELEAFSPISTSCEANYPGGPLAGEEVPDATTIRVGILDTGLDPYYPTINQYVVAEANVLTDDADPQAGITIAYGYDPVNPIAADDNGHGTAVAGIIAGLSDRVDLPSFTLELYIIKCFDDQGNGTLFNMIQALRLVEFFDLDLINLSWGYTPVPQDENAMLLNDVLHYLGNERDVIIVTGTGNVAQDVAAAAYCPASIETIENLVTVAGTVGLQEGCDGNIARFSGYGDPADIAAPAASISVPGLDGYWAVNTSGTSFATPIVTSAIVQAWMSHSHLADDPHPLGTRHPICDKVLSTTAYVSQLPSFGVEGVVDFEAACNTTPGGTLGLHSGSSEPGAWGNAAGLPDGTSPLTVTPNPFTQQVTISSVHPQASERHVTVTSLQGAIMLRQAVPASGSATIQVALPDHLPSGAYLLKLQEDGAVHTKIIVKS